MEEAASRLKQILMRAEGLGVRKNLAHLESFQRLLKFNKIRSLKISESNLKSNGKMPFAIWWLLTIGLAVSFVTMIASSKTWTLNLRQECLVEVPDRLTLITRPPVDCSMCREVKAVDRVTAIAPLDFETRYAYSGRPVVIKDAMTNWTAPQTFSFSFLKEIYSDSLSSMESPQDRCQFFPYDTDFRSLREVFNMDEERAAMKPGCKPWYVGWSNCDERVARQLRSHYGRPYFLPNLSENKNVDWIFMGSSGYGAGMHVDNVRHPSWQAQLRGTKLWSLQPPPECLYECQSFSVVVEPGEIIVLDTNRWYHSTKIVSDDISITIGAEYD